MTLTEKELMNIVNRAFNAGEIESQITEKESKQATFQILKNCEKVEKMHGPIITDSPVQVEYDPQLRKTITDKIKELESPRNHDDSDQYHDRLTVINAFKKILEKTS